MNRKPWDGELEIAEGWAVWRGRTGEGRTHRHVAAQAAFASTGFVEVERACGAIVAADCVLVEPLSLHRIVPGCEVELVFVEPWVRWSRVPILASRRERIRCASSVTDASKRIPAAEAYWLPGLTPSGAGHRSQTDPWAAEARAHLDRLVAHGGVRLSELANHFELSGERVRHRFSRATGMPFKRYILWRRMRLSVLCMTAGANATQAAHEAGFADSAHFARSLKAMFGISATQLVSSG